MLLHKKNIWILVIVVMVQVVYASTNPFSQISIQSEKASCKKHSSTKDLFLFQYVQNVHVLLADNSTIDADRLDITFLGRGLDAQGKKKGGRATLDNFKKVAFVGHVIVKNGNRIVHADRADVDVANYICTLVGNVHVEQAQHEQKDIPLKISSTRATINLTTKEVVFEGSVAAPVSTVIALGDKSLFGDKTKEQKA